MAPPRSLTHATNNPDRPCGPLTPARGHARRVFSNQETSMFHRLIAALAIAMTGLCGLSGCATTGQPQADQFKRIVASGMAITLDVDALLDNGSTPEERARLRLHVSWALLAISNDHPVVQALAPALAKNGVLTPEEKANLLAAIPQPIGKVLVEMTLNLHTSGAFREEDWRLASHALIEWAAAPPPPTGGTP